MSNGIKDKTLELIEFANFDFQIKSSKKVR